MKIRWLKRHLLSKMNSFYYNSMKLCHIIKYNNVFKFQNGPYASCLQELLPFVNDNSLFMRIWQKRGHPCSMGTFLVLTFLWVRGGGGGRGGLVKCKCIYFCTNVRIWIDFGEDFGETFGTKIGLLICYPKIVDY